MKHVLLMLAVMCSTLSLAQNTFPVTGNVGIGTNNPSADLDVMGELKVDSCMTVRDSAIVEDGMRVEGDLRVLGLHVIGESTFGGIVTIEDETIFKNFEDLSLNEDRIAFIRPDGQLKMGSLSNITNIAHQEDCFPFSPDGGQSFFQAPSWSSEGGPNINDAIMYTGVTCPARVGIGEDDPFLTFHVEGGSYFKEKLIVGGFVNNMGTSGYNAQLALDLEGTSASNPDPIYVRGASDETYFKVANDANIGIGTFTPTYRLHMHAGDANSSDPLLIENDDQELLKLDHSGLLQCREVMVTLDPFADYVFDDDYDLLSIQEVKQHIDSKGHLPNMPSAEEIHENGMGVGELLVKQQEKIEELTLYIIQQQEQIDELKSLIEKR